MHSKKLLKAFLQNSPKTIFIWSLLATSASAFCTFLYALAAYQTSWSHDFIQLYALLGFCAGWINTGALYFVPHHPALQSRRFSFVFFVSAALLVCILYPALFPGAMSQPKILFVFGSMAPILYVNQFASRFARGDYWQAYIRSVLNNSFLAAGALFTLLMGADFDFLAHSAAAAGLMIAVTWAFDAWPASEKKAGGENPLRGLLNPAVVSMERSVWDQVILASYYDTKWSFLIFIGAKVVAFTGNSAQNYFLGQSVDKQHDRLEFKPAPSFFLLTTATLIAGLGLLFADRLALLTGSITAWLLGVSLSGSFKSVKGRTYEAMLGIWACDFAARGAAFIFCPTFEVYIAISAASSLILIAWILYKQRSQTL